MTLLLLAFLSLPVSAAYCFCVSSKERTKRENDANQERTKRETNPEYVRLKIAEIDFASGGERRALDSKSSFGTNGHFVEAANEPDRSAR